MANHGEFWRRPLIFPPKAEVTSSNLVGRASATKHLAETEGQDCNALSAEWLTPTDVTSAAFHQARCFQGVSDHSTDIKGRRRRDIGTLRHSKMLVQHFPFEWFGSRICFRSADERLFRRNRCSAALHRSDVGAIPREAKEFCDVIRRRNPDFEKKRSGSAALLIGIACRKRCAVRHVGDRIGFDQLIARAVNPDLAGIAIDHSLERWPCREAMDIRPLLDNFNCVGRYHCRVGIAMPDGYSRPCPTMG